VARSQLVFEVTSLCRCTWTQPCLSLVNGFISGVTEPLHQLVNVAFQFLSNVTQVV